MTTKSDKPLWVQHLEGTVPRSNDNWKTTSGPPGYDTSSLKKGKDTGSLTKVSGKTTPHSDTASLLSRGSKARRGRRGKRGAGWIVLAVLLILLALLLAIGLGFLVYFLLLGDLPFWWQGHTLADSSVRILNETYHPDMANSSSQAFQRIADPFCQEMGKYLNNSDYEKYYDGCRVTELRDVGLREDCTCYAEGHGSLEVIYELSFKGKHKEDLSIRIPEIIEDNTRKVSKGDSLLVLIKYFLVDHKIQWKEPYNGVLADMTFHVYNLTYSKTLAYANSTTFLQHAQPFCSDIDEFLRGSWLRSKYIGCHVTQFGEKPVTISFELKFRGSEPKDLQNALIYIIMKAAPDVKVNKVTLKLIGDLLVLPHHVDLSLVPLYITTTTATPTTTPAWPGNAVYIREGLRVINLNYTIALSDPSSTEFKGNADPFCRELGHLFKKSEYWQRYFGCKVYTFKNDPDSVIVTVVFEGKDRGDLDHSIINVIKKHATREPNYKDPTVYRVGNLLIILGDRDSTMGPTSVFPQLTSTITSTLVLSTSKYSGPLFRVPLKYPLFRFAYAPSLTNSTSELFRSYQTALCGELERMFRRSKKFQNMFYECRIDRFSSDPREITFSVTFMTEGSQGLWEATRDTLETDLGHINVTGVNNMIYKVIPVGGMMLLLDQKQITPPGTKTVILPAPTKTVTVTKSAPPPSSSLTPDPNDVTLQMRYFLYDFQYKPSLAFSNSPDFQTLQAKLCERLTMIYKVTATLGHVMERCGIKDFRTNPNSITFYIGFTSQYPDSLRQVAIETLHKSEPHVILEAYELLPVSDMYFILSGQEIKTTSYLPYSTSSISPSSTVVMTSTADVTTPPLPGYTVAAIREYDLFNLNWRPDLLDPNSELFLYYQTRFCQDIKKEYSQSFLHTGYRHCKIDKFKNLDPSNRKNNTVTFTLYFETPVYPKLQQHIVDVIEKYSPQRNVSGNTITTFGDLNLILGRFTSLLVDPNRSSTYEFPSTIFNTIKSTLSIPVMSTSIITTTPDPRENYILSLFDYGLINFRYYPELADPESSMFKLYENLFCNDIASFYLQSLLASAYRDCQITHFSPDAKNVSFRLWFDTPMFDQLQGLIINTLEDKAPKLNISTYTVLDVGELYLEWKNYTHRLVRPDPITTIWWSMSTTAISPTPTPTIVTPSIEPTTPAPSYITAVFKYGLLNFDWYEDLNDPNSMMFKLYQRRFCSDIVELYKNSYLAAAYIDCQIIDFSRDGKDFTFHLNFQHPMFPKMQAYILEVLHGAPKLNISAHRVLDIGDLYLIIANYTYVLVPKIPDVTSLTYTFTPTSTPVMTSTPLMTSSSIAPPEDNWLQAVFDWRLLNFVYYPELKDPTSMLFTIYERKFCYDIEQFYKRSILSFAYRDCAIRCFSPDGKLIEFEINFETSLTPSLQGYILSVIETQAPRLNISRHTVLDVGDLYLIWGNYSYIIVTPRPSITTVTWSSTPLPPMSSTEEPMMTSSIIPTTTPAPEDWVLAIFNYTVYEINWHPDLAVPGSNIYKLYEKKFCDDVKRFYTGTYLERAYKGCEVTKFSKNTGTLDFRIFFDTPVFPSLQGDILYFFENSAPKFNISTSTVLGVGDIYLLWKNFTYYIVTPLPSITTVYWPSESIAPTSTVIVTPTPTTPTTPTTTTTEDPSKRWLRAVFDFDLLEFIYVDELADPNSVIFKLYERKFCDDIKRVYGNSYLSMVFRECKIREFGRDGSVKFQMSFETSMFPSLIRDIINILYEGSPKKYIRNFHVIEVGDLNLIWDLNNVTVVPPDPASTTLTYMPSSSVPPMTSTSIEPSMTSSIIESASPTPTPPGYILAIFRFGLLNFQSYPELKDTNSALFKVYVRKFCDDIRRFYSNSYLSTLLRNCEISEFGLDMPHTIRFIINFETQLFERLRPDILEVLHREAPKFNMSGFTVLEAGDLYLIWANFTMILVDGSSSVTHTTTMPITPSSTIQVTPTATTPIPEKTFQLKISFEILNKTQKGIDDVNSVAFKMMQEEFCSEVSQMIMREPPKFQDYKSCNIDTFTGDPLRVNFSLHFTGQQAEQIKLKVVDRIIEVATRENYRDLIGVRIGDLLIAMENITVHIHDYSTLPPSPTTTAIAYDALLYNITFSMYPGNYSVMMSDQSSAYFKQVEEEFCTDIRRYMQASFLKERYYSCSIEKIVGGSSPLLIANIIKTGIYDFGPKIIYNFIKNGATQVTFGGRTWLKIGNLLVYADNPGESILIQLASVMTTTPVITTPAPNSYTMLDFRANLVNMAYDASLADRNSQLFKNYAVPFCQFLGQEFTRRNRFPDYFGCMVTGFSNNPFAVQFSLRFRGIQKDFISTLVLGTLIEWTKKGEEYLLVAGPLSLDEMSLRVRERYIRNGVEFTREPPKPTTPASPTIPTTTEGQNPCTPGRFSIEPHPRDCNKFFLCTTAAIKEMTCAPGKKFNTKHNMCLAPPPGFVCNL